MITEFERRLSEFVDRNNEIELFYEMIEEADAKPVMIVWGEGGVGKTSLLARMIHECAIRKLRKVELVWTEVRNHDYLAIMREIRDDTNPDFFKPFTDLINFFTVPHYELTVNVGNVSSITVAKNGQIESSTTGDIAGIVVKDFMLAAPRQDMAIPENERMARLTDCFIENLSECLETGPLMIIFFDAVEKMTEVTHKWVWQELIRSLHDGRLQNIRFVLCGRQEPMLNRDMYMIVEDARLKPLVTEHIMEYLAKRGVVERSRSDLASMLLVATQGNPLQIATLVDGFLKLQKRKYRKHG